MWRLVLSLLVIFCSHSALAKISIDPWLMQERDISLIKLLQNFSPADAAPGVVIASPEKLSPNYYFHWTRDAALSVNTVVSLFENSTGAEKQDYHDRALLYARFSRQTQLASVDIGEPKYYVDGRPFDGRWCRPQSDGPALRAITLSRFANLLLNQSERKTVSSLLYDSVLPTNSIIKTDLEYVASHWQNTTCDLWEEVEGNHFYTRMAQRRALLDGAALADTLKDPEAANWYRRQAGLIERSLADFWNGSIIVPTLNQTGGLKGKMSGIDSSVILAALHSGRGDGFLPLSHPHLLATFQAQVEIFRQKYPINQNHLGVAIGRYPEDTYDGADYKHGNPWVLLTAAFARYCFGVAMELFDQGNGAEARRYIDQGDGFLERIKLHANPDGSLSEQMDKYSGYMVSARDLTWNYSEFIEAVAARKAAYAKVIGTR